MSEPDIAMLQRHSRPPTITLSAPCGLSQTRPVAYRQHDTLRSRKESAIIKNIELKPREP
eukprot:6193643-Pleurochrysis_carterae.AAC.2